jgi:hypothetical protein
MQTNSAFVIKHRLAFDGLQQANLAQKLIELEALAGIIQVEKVNGWSHQLFMKYDASKTQLPTLLSKMAEWEITPTLTWWNKVKLSWALQVDQNVLDNSRHVHHCCSKAPEQGRIKR